MAAAIGFFQDLLSKVTMAFMLPTVLDHKIDKALLSGPKSIQELTVNTQINPERLHRFLTHLESNGLFSFNQETQKWSHTELSASLTAPFINALCQWQFSAHVLQNFLHLDKILESDQNAYQIQGKSSAFEDLKQSPRMFQVFHTWMTAITNASEGPLANALELDGVNSLIDVGGANGSLCIALSKKHPEIQFGVFDLPECAEIAQKNINDHALNEKIQVIAGSFLESVPGNFDAITLKNVLHDWTDDESLTILQNCRNALENGKKLFIIDSVQGRNSQLRAFHTHFDISMMTNANGKVRNKEEFEELLCKSRFRLEKVIEAGLPSIIVAIAV